VYKDRLIAEGTWNISEDADSMWKEITICIRKVIVEVFEVTRGNKCKPKNTWWWNESIQKVINEKKMLQTFTSPHE
jgi:hypothetical protein